MTRSRTSVGDLADTEATILVKGSDMPYVSRGGLKLEKGLAVFEMPVAGKTFIDIGSSTGGFTDCLLQNGAEKFMQLMSVTDNWTGSYETIPGLYRWNGLIFGIWRLKILPRWLTAPLWMSSSRISITKLILWSNCLWNPEPGDLGWLSRSLKRAGKESVKTAWFAIKKCMSRFCLKSGPVNQRSWFLTDSGPKGNIEFLVLVENSWDRGWRKLVGFDSLSGKYCPWKLSKKKDPQDE